MGIKESDSQTIGHCALCNKETNLTFHHLIPKSNHKNKWFRKTYSLEEMRTAGIMVCRPCHSTIHKTHSEKVLGRKYNTLEKLLADEAIQRFIDWRKKR